MVNNKTLPLGARAGGLSFSIAVIINLVISMFASVIIIVFSLGGTDGEKYISLLVSPIAIAVTLTLMVMLFKQPVSKLLPVKCHPKYYLIGFMLIFGLLFSLSWVNDLLIRLFELMGYTRKQSFLPDMTGAKIIPVLLVVAVIPAVMEEILFRGILLSNIEEGVGSIRTVLLVGLCFSLYHGSVEQTIYQFICGCLFAFLALRSRSVAPAVIIHFINNALIIILNACGLVDPVSGALIMEQLVEIMLYVLSALSLIGGIVWLVLDKKELKQCANGEVKSFFIFASVGIGAMILLWIIGLFL